MRPSSAYDGSSGVTGRSPWGPVAMRGMMALTSRGLRAQASMAGTSSNRASASSVFCVGVMSLSWPLAAREQQAAFLEAFAHRGDVEGEAAGREAEPCARLGVRQPAAAGAAVGVGAVEHPAGEDPRAAGMVAPFRAAQQQDLRAGRRIA